MFYCDPVRAVYSKNNSFWDLVFYDKIACIVLEKIIYGEYFCMNSF